ncbi:MAG: hypothetical protein HZA50_00605 [Planctomycetes bacterium]|nr:hypothetical protein [Planctomycetota bacterium]
MLTDEWGWATALLAEYLELAADELLDALYHPHHAAARENIFVGHLCCRRVLCLLSNSSIKNAHSGVLMGAVGFEPT